MITSDLLSAARRQMVLVVLLVCLIGLAAKASTLLQTVQAHFPNQGGGMGMRFHDFSAQKSATDRSQFSYYGAVQFVDPDGRNGVSFWPGHPNTYVDFTLYVLPVPDFTLRYANYDPYQASIDVSGLAAVATWQEYFSDGYTWQTVGLPTGVVSGVYILSASQQDAADVYTYILASRAVLALKQADAGQIVVWATNLQSQLPLPGMDISLYDQQGSVVAVATTGADGVAHFDMESDLDIDDNLPFLAVGRQGDQVTLVGLDGAWRSDDGSYYWMTPTTLDYRVYLYADRPIYRPGQTIYYAATLRHDDDFAYQPVAASQPVTATLHDSRNNLVATQIVTTDDFGSIEGQFVLGDEPPLGVYTIEIAIDDETHRQSLRVESYRKPEYQVSVTAPVTYALTGDSIVITVDTNYYFGQPVAEGEVVLTVFRQPTYWSGYGREGAPLVVADGADAALSNQDTRQVLELRGTTNSQGRWQTTVPLQSSDEWDSLYTFQASVTDAVNQPVDGKLVLPVYWNTFRLAAHTDRYGYGPGESVTVKVATRTHEGQAVAHQLIKVSVTRNYWESADPVSNQEIVSDADGTAVVTFNNLSEGWYRYEATTVDSRQRQVQATGYFWIYDWDGGYGWRAPSDDLAISADRTSYVPGDTAHLLIQSRINGVALLTLERGRVYHEQVVTLTNAATMVDVPILTHHAPNVIARLHLFVPSAAESNNSQSEGRLLIAQTELSVPVEDKQLAIEIVADAAQYGPGDEAILTVRVADANSRPVAAQIGLALVDEAIFALSEDLSADIFETFYGRRVVTVLTRDTLAQGAYWPIFAAPEDGGGPTPTPVPTAGDLTANSSTRRVFLDTAYWNPAIETGVDGLATVTVQLPDNLTTWRIIARAVTTGTQVGQTTDELLVTQEIIARPVLPRFSVLGDRFDVGVLAQNFSGADTNGTVTLDGDHLLLLDSGARALTLPNGGGDLAGWTAVASHIGTGLITATLDTTAGQDRVVLPLSTLPFAVPARASFSGQLGPGNLAITEVVTLPLNAILDDTDITLRLSPSLALSMVDGLDDLIDYPYGCVEQTMSRVLPSAVAARVYSDLGIPNPKADQLPDIVAQGLQRLYGFQHEDGSWGWWYDDAGALYMTAYVLFGLVSVEQSGFAVDETVLQRGFTFLDSLLAAAMADEPGATAFALYVKSLAGRGDLTLTRILATQLNRLTAADRAALALTLHLEGDNATAQAVLASLLSQVEETPTTAFWPVAEDWSWYHWRTMASTEKNTALGVYALSVLDPGHPLLPKAVRWLMAHRQGAGWRNTQATAFAVLGLAKTIQTSGALQADYTYRVRLNGEIVANGVVTPGSVFDPIESVVAPGSLLRVGNNTLQIERDRGTGMGQLYYTGLVRQELFYDGFEQVSSAGQGLTLTRSYRSLDGSDSSSQTYQIGDLVEVNLTLQTTDEMGYLIIEDPLPAGFEALNERVNPVAYGDAFAPLLWEYWGYNRKNVRDDRVDFFVTQLWPGQHTFTYLMRATTAGEYSVLPAQAYPMYETELWGRSASNQVRVAPDRLAARPPLAGDVDRDCRVTTFDARQMIAAWGTSNSARDVNGDGVLDMYDVGAVAGRLGATCLADRQLPGMGTEAALVVVTVPEPDSVVGQTLAVELRIASSADLAAFGLTLTFNPAQLQAASVTLEPSLNAVIPLGPRIDNQTGQIKFGLVDMEPMADSTAASLPVQGKVATVHFMPIRPGAVTISAVGQALDREGRLVSVFGGDEASAHVDGKVQFAPVVGR